MITYQIRLRYSLDDGIRIVAPFAPFQSEMSEGQRGWIYIEAYAILNYCGS